MSYQSSMIKLVYNKSYPDHHMSAQYSFNSTQTVAYKITLISDIFLGNINIIVRS